MMRYDYDVIVVGGGPAGATCAWFLGHAGLRVLLLNRGAPRASGSVMVGQAKGSGVLHEMGLAQELDQLPSLRRCRELLISAGSGAAMRLQGAAGWRLCDRQEFDQWLLRHARRVAAVQEPWRVTDLMRADDGRIAGVVAYDESSGLSLAVTGRVVVAADGSSSVVASRAGLTPWRSSYGDVAWRSRWLNGAPTAAIEYHVVHRPVVACLWRWPSRDGADALGLAIDAPVQRKISDPQAVFDSILERHPHLRERFGEGRVVSPWHGWPLAMARTPHPVSTRGVVAVGDAAWAVTPLFGDALDTALLSGRLAARVIAGALECGAPTAALAGYDVLLWRALRAERYAAKMLRGLVRRRLGMELLVHVGAIRQGTAAAAAGAWRVRSGREVVAT